MVLTSVIIPTYNCGQYLNDAVDSALSQVDSGVTVEVIVIDDGSTDTTAEVISQRAHPSLHYVQQPNQGVSAARNHGIRLAQGELIAFLDADDWFLPGKLAQQAALFAANPQLGLVQSGWQRVDEQGQVLKAVTPWQTVPDLTLEHWLRAKPVLPSALMIRREWLAAVGGFDTQLQAAEDVDLVARLALKGCNAAWLRQVAVSYRQRTQSAMGSGLAQLKGLSLFLDKFFQRSDLPEHIRFLENQIRYNTLIWVAWYLHHTGHPTAMAQTLQQAWRYTPHLPLEAVAYWMDSFAMFSQEVGVALSLAGLTQQPEWQQLLIWLLDQSTALPSLKLPGR